MTTAAALPVSSLATSNIDVRDRLADWRTGWLVDLGSADGSATFNYSDQWGRKKAGGSYTKRPDTNEWRIDKGQMNHVLGLGESGAEIWLTRL